MKRVSLITLSVILVVAALTGTFWTSQRVRALNVRLHAKGLPEHGISLIAAGHPAFDALVASYAQRHPATPPEALKPFSVFIRNDAERAVVAYKLKWECFKADGTSVTKQVSDATTYIFLHGEESERALVVARADSVMRPGATWFVSLGLPAEPVEGQEEVTNQVNVAIRSEQAAPPTEASEPAAFLNASNAELSQYTDITVSIDGAFFDEGTFVGPDSTGFFDEIASQMDARRDVLLMVRDGVQAGKSHDQIYDSLQQMASGPEVELGRSPTKEDFYAFSKRMFLKDTIGSKNIYGKEKATKKVQEQLGKPWVRLKKK